MCSWPGGWRVVVLAAAIGHAVARRTLRPVRAASAAAHALAQGVLETRLDGARLDEFGAWARDFNEMAEALQLKITQLSEVSQRERRFTADVAHELRTPLTAVVAAGAVLEEQLPDMPPRGPPPARAARDRAEPAPEPRRRAAGAVAAGGRPGGRAGGALRARPTSCAMPSDRAAGRTW